MLIENVLELTSPENPLPLIFDSPHSGMIYPADFNYICDRDTLEKAEDKYVDDLFSEAPNHGACLLSAPFPRSYLDVNRARDDIDPELISRENLDNWAYPDCTPINPTNRSYAGIGLIRRLAKPGEPVYDHNLSPKDIKSRIDTYYTPYHNTLEKIIDGAHYNFGKVYHINCHSMPSATHSTGALGRINPYTAPDFVLGDRDGTTCDIDFTHALRDFIKSLGYKVAINNPYKGVELVKRYSAPAMGRHSIQIEICRSLYLNEDTYEKSKNYDKLKTDITKLITFTADYVQSNLTQLAAD